MVGFELLEGDKYYKSLLEEIPKAKKRIVIASMVLLWGERTGPLIVLLQDALERGVQVTLLLDNYTRLTYLYGATGKSASERLQQTFRVLEKLSAQGAKIHIFGKLGFPPQKGRCHVKITVVDNHVYSFGGVNFYDGAFDTIDYMLYSKNPAVADCTVQLVERICQSRPPLADGEVKLDKNTHVLFDGGRQKQSIIYERACELASQSKHIYYASQMVPSGELARLLNETNSTIYFNRPEQMRPLDGIAQAFDQQKYRVENSYTGSSLIHAKVLLFELAGGKKALLSGSHNFSYRGVKFGTQEICLYSTDQKLWDDLLNFVQKRIA